MHLLKTYAIAEGVALESRHMITDMQPLEGVHITEGVFLYHGYILGDLYLLEDLSVNVELCIFI